MAYICKETETIVLYPHKTGTHTLRNILKEHGRIDVIKYSAGNNHPSIDQLRVLRPDMGNPEKYDVYAFYREPIEKFLSFMAYNYRLNSLMTPTSSVMEYYEMFGHFAPQVRWLKHPTVDVQLLNFHDFENEMRRLFRRINIPVNTPIPKLNESPNRKKPSDLTAEEIAFIKDLYKEDYEFFASKGITFPI
jgi:hypothetical protein